MTGNFGSPTARKNLAHCTLYTKNICDGDSKRLFTINVFTPKMLLKFNILISNNYLKPLNLPDRTPKNFFDTFTRCVVAVGFSDIIYIFYERAKVYVCACIPICITREYTFKRTRKSFSLSGIRCTDWFLAKWKLNEIKINNFLLPWVDGPLQNICDPIENRDPVFSETKITNYV